MARVAMFEKDGKRLRKVVPYTGWCEKAEFSSHFSKSVIKKALKKVDMRDAHLVHSHATH